jgi:hypothetical protein
MQRVSTIFLSGSLLLTLACARSNDLPPLTSPSTGQPTYATRYAESLAATRGSIDQQENKAERLMGEMSQFTTALDAKDWNHVATTYKLADSAGRSSDYAERHEQNEAVTTFFEEDKQDIQNGVVGATQYTAKQNDCKDPNQVGGAALHGLNKAVDKALQDKMRDHDEAHSYIAAHSGAIGEKALEKLREQADKISEAAFMVFVGVEKSRRRLKSKIDESADVKKTLQRAAEQDSTASSDALQPDADRKSARARAAAENDALMRADAELQQAQHVLTEIDQRVTKLRTDYDQAFKALMSAVDAKLKSKP